MMEIPPEFVLKTLQNAYEKYDIYIDTDKTKALKIYGFCDGLEKLIYKFAPEFTEEVQSMRSRCSIVEIKLKNSSTNLEEPTWLRNNIFD